MKTHLLFSKVYSSFWMNFDWKSNLPSKLFSMICWNVLHINFRKQLNRQCYKSSKYSNFYARDKKSDGCSHVKKTHIYWIQPHSMITIDIWSIMKKKKTFKFQSMNSKYIFMIWWFKQQRKTPTKCWNSVWIDSAI